VGINLTSLDGSLIEVLLLLTGVRTLCTLIE